MAEEVQYRIEIQDGHGFVDEGDVVIVLDLNGQDLPETIAQTIMELAHNPRHVKLRGAEHSTQTFVEEAQKQGQNGQIIENDTKVDGNDIHKAGQLTTDIQGESQQKILVHDLAELEQTRAGSVRASTHVHSKTASSHLVKSLPELEQMKCKSVSRFPMEELDPSDLTLTDTKGEVGVQCKIITERDNSTVVLTEANAENIPDGDIQNVKNEPLWAEDGVNAAIKPAESQEISMVLDQPAVEKSCPHCEFTCSQDIELGRHLKQVHKENKSFLCLTCGASFKLELSFQIHATVHAKKSVPKQKSKYICPLCNTQCKTQWILRYHAKKKHNVNTLLTCTECCFVCFSKTEMVEHNKSLLHKRKRNKVSICPVCKVACFQLAVHLASAHPDHCPHSCNECNFKSKTTYGLKTHMLIHTENKNCVCPQCNRACKSKLSLKRHIKNHNPDKKYQCSSCSFSSNDSYEIKRHNKRVHTRNTNYSCKFCNLSFVNHCDLKMHAMSEHKSRDTFYCNYKQCDFSCEEKAEFKWHVQTHTGMHQYLCHICEFTTPNKAYLDRHLVVHGSLKPFICEVCGFECRAENNLKRHMVIHSEDKPFQCSKCPFTCKLKNLLDSHTRIMHTNLKPYACSQCPYITKTNSNLKKHMWIHEQHRPFQCPYCSYTAREKNKLRCHVNCKHGVIMSEALVEKQS